MELLYTDEENDVANENNDAGGNKINNSKTKSLKLLSKSFE